MENENDLDIEAAAEQGREMNWEISEAGEMSLELMCFMLDIE